MFLADFIWNNKIKLLITIILLFVFSLFKIISSQIFFDTERIIKEISVEEGISKKIDDENLIFFGLSTKRNLQYNDFLELKKIHEKIKSHKTVKRVSSVINERKIVQNSFFPSSRSILNLKDIESYNESISKKDIIESNFIDSTKTKFLFLIESNNNLSAEDRKLLIDDLYKIKLSNIDSDSFISGRIPSEVYFQKKVIREFIILTTLSAILCFILLYFLTTNLKFIFFTISSVIISIVISLSLSTVIFSGLEMIMIISPAILFIVCVSDIMHYTSNQKDYNDKLLFFKDRIDRVGKAIFLTSLTTSFGFLTFLFNDIIPIARFGIITSFGILFTLIVVTIVYAIEIIILTKSHKSFVNRLHN